MPMFEQLKRAQYLARMLRAQWQSSAVLRAAQNDALRVLVRHAARHVPFYRDLYSRHGIAARAFRGLEDLPSLPLVDKRQLRAAGEQVLADDRPADLVKISTSGSTGEPFEFHIDRRHDQWRKAQYLRPYLANGRRLSDKVLRLTAFPAQRRPWFTALGLLREWQLDCATDPATIIAEWREIEPSILQGYPSSLRTLAQHCLGRGERLDPAPRRVFTDSEMLDADTRAILEQTFGTPVIDIFGTYETDNIAYQCNERGGYHVTLDSVVLEVVGGDGREVASGEDGELVVTVLTNRTHPFIRYRLGDIGRISAAPCACGRGFPLLEVISGRADDMIVLADGTQRTPMDVLARLDGFAASLRHYQFHQLATDRFELWVVPAAGYSSEAADRILQSLQARLPHTAVTLKIVAAIPREPSGKLRAFIRHSQAQHRG